MLTIINSLCLLCLWTDLPVWVKALLLLGLIAVAVLGGWWAGVIAAGYWGWGTLGVILAGAAAGAFEGYVAQSIFSGLDAMVWDMTNPDLRSGIDAMEDLINLTSPVPAPVADATGLKMPGAEASDGLIDQAIDAAQAREDRYEKIWREATED